MAKYIYENKISLDDSISEHIKGLDSSRYYPNLRRLATHTAGYSGMLPLNKREILKMIYDMTFGLNQDKIPFPQKSESIEDIIQRIRLQDRDYKWEYSNFGFAVIGHILGIVSGKGYQDMMGEFILDELGLTDTYLGTNNRNLHGFNRRNKDCANWTWDEHYMLPAGAISSSADALLTYAQINMNEEKPYLPLCHQKYASISKEYDIGLGWWLHKNNNNILQHEGGTGCFGSALLIDKDNKLAVVVMANYKLAMPSEKPIALAVLESL